MTDSQDKSSASVTAVLGPARSAGRLSWLRPWLIGAAIIAVALFAWFFLRSGNQADKISYQVESVSLGKLIVKVSATGNLQPTNQVDVGCEISGTLETVLVDDNDRVRKGQILARLDTSKLQDQVEKSQAGLTASEAKVQQSVATTNEVRANLQRLKEVSRLSGGKVPSQTEMAAAEATLARGEADEANARAAVIQAMATLRSDRTNLSKATILSPIDGVVLLRQVEPGQTVAASLQAPVLFTLAEDLSQMELQVAVDEADVGQVREGQGAIFNVDAYPNRVYPAQVTRVGYGSQTTNGVVSYLTILKVNNDDLTLRPGMTATAEITTLMRDKALLVPNAALRYVPPVTTASKSSSSLVSSLIPRPSRSTSIKSSFSDTSKGSEQKVWILSDDKPESLAVTIGATDGRHTEIVSGNLKEGQEVITESSGLTPQ